MDELQARRRADELGGIAVQAQWIESVGAWVLLDGRDGPRVKWIVVSRNRRDLLDGGEG